MWFFNPSKFFFSSELPIWPTATFFSLLGLWRWNTRRHVARMLRIATGMSLKTEWRMKRSSFTYFTSIDSMRLWRISMLLSVRIPVDCLRRESTDTFPLDAFQHAKKRALEVRESTFQLLSPKTPASEWFRPWQHHSDNSIRFVIQWHRPCSCFSSSCALVFSD